MPKAEKSENLQIRITINKPPKSKSYSKILGKSKGHGRSRVEIKESKKILDILITAKDTTALRAQANSVLRDLQVIEATQNLRI